MKFRTYLEEEIKGWKHAHGDLHKSRADAGKDVMLHRLKNDGHPSGTHDAQTMHKSEDDARRHHEQMKKNNPGKKIMHNLHKADGTVEKLD
jgi:hypothetical protein